MLHVVSTVLTSRDFQRKTHSTFVLSFEEAEGSIWTNCVGLTGIADASGFFCPFCVPPSSALDREPGDLDRSELAREVGVAGFSFSTCSVARRDSAGLSG
jgi:hypothetical protein